MLKEASNATKDDNYAEQKIIQSLKNKPLVSLRGSELKRQLNIDV